MARILDIRVLHDLVQNMARSAGDYTLWSDDGMIFPRHDKLDRLMVRVRPHYPVVTGYVDAQDLMWTAQHTVEAVAAAVHQTAAAARGSVFRQILAGTNTVDWLGGGDADVLLTRIDNLMIQLAEAAAEIKATAHATAKL